MRHLEIFVCEAEKQATINAVVHKLLSVLTQANVLRPIAHLCNCPVMDIMLHGLLHGCGQPSPACLQTLHQVSNLQEI